MLELLAGPFPVTFMGEQTTFGTRPVWHDAYGFISACRDPDSALLRQVVCQIDGQAYVRAQNVLGHLTLNLATGGIAVYDHPYVYAESDPRTFRPLGEFEDITAFSGAVSGQWTWLADRRIYSTSGVVFAWEFGATSRTTEHTFSSVVTDPGSATITPAGQPGRVFLSYPSGRIYEYDYLEKTIVGVQRYIEENEWAYYSPALGVFISVTLEGDVHQIRVWANEVAAETIVSPNSTDTVAPGRVVNVQTTVLGDHSEVCPDRVVSWSTTAGTILDERTTTDEDGVARTRLRLAPDELATVVYVTAELVQ